MKNHLGLLGPTAKLKGMYLFYFLFFSYIYASSLPKENILQFPYGTNFKFNGLLHHKVDRVWVVTKFPIPQLSDINFPIAELDLSCEHIIAAIAHAEATHKGSYIKSLSHTNLVYMKKICLTSVPIFKYMKQKQDYYQSRVTTLITNELTKLTPQVEVVKRQKRFIAAFLPSIAGLFSIAVEQLSGHLQRKRNQAIRNSLRALKTEMAMNSENIVKQFNKELILFGHYNLQGMKNILATINNVNNHTSSFADNVVGSLKQWQDLYVTTQQGSNLYAHHLQLYLHVIQSRNFELYESLISVLERYLRAVGTLSRGYLPSELFPPTRLKPIITKALATVHKKNPHYVSSLDSVSDYYDMPLVTFSLDLDNTFVVTFPILVQPRMAIPLTLYEIETVKVPVNDTNYAMQSYTEAIIPKPYIAATSLTYIQLKLTELRMCKHVAYFYFCEEVFLVKYRNHHTCASALLYNSSQPTIMSNCQFSFYPNISVSPSILDGGDTIVLANYDSPKSLECHTPYPQGFSLPSSSYVKVNKSILCHCDLRAGSTRLGSSLSACNDYHTLSFNFTINLPFLLTMDNYLNTTVLKHIPTYETDKCYQFPLAIQNVPAISDKILLKDYANYLADLQGKDNLLPFKGQKGSNRSKIKAPKRLSFLSQILRYLTVAAVTICVIVIMALCCLAVKHFKLSLLVGGLLSLPNTNASPIGATEKVSCQEPWLTFFVAVISLLGVAIYIARSYRKMTFFKGFKYNNEVAIYVVIGDNSHFVPIKVKTVNGNAHLFNMSATITRNRLSLMRHSIWDILHINWDNVKIYKRDEEITLPKCIYIPLIDKIKIRYIMSQPEQMVYMMLKQGNTWNNLQTNSLVIRPSTSGDEE